jgi:phospholipid transport system substrate-binding protein
MAKGRAPLLRAIRFAVAACLLVSLGGSPVFASTPKETLKASVDAIVAILQDPELRKPAKVVERRKAIHAIVVANFDFHEIGKRALARHWQDRTPEEREEFVVLFSDLLWRTYIDILEKYENESVQYLGEDVRDGLAQVSTSIVSKGREIAVDYRLMSSGENWRVYDVLVEGISLVNNYRAQFDKLILSKSFDHVVRFLHGRMDTALAEERKKLRESGI